MGLRNKFISNEQAVPIIQNKEIFTDITPQYATIPLGYGVYPETVNPDLFKAYLELRKRVYIDQTNMLPESVGREDGTEIDDDDFRSEHFIIAQRRDVGKIAIVACMREIIKTDERPLPIEEFFPEAFTHPAPVGSTEVSRFISRIENRIDQLGSIASIFTAGLAMVDKRDLAPVYGVVEPELELSLGFFGAPPHRIAEPKEVQEYNDINLGITINTDAMKTRIGESALASIDLTPGVPNYWGKRNRKKIVS